MISDLIHIQNELKVPKSTFNQFGKYRYRSAEDILASAKPLLEKYSLSMTISDEVILIGNRFYVKATVTITDREGNSERATAFAREDETKKGMDGSQVSGSASAYARKYALCGLFLIDSSKDANCSRSQAQSMSQSYCNDMTHREEKIGPSEVEALKKACSAAGENMSLEKALAACRRTSAFDISRIQYEALMSQLGAS